MAKIWVLSLVLSRLQLILASEPFFLFTYFMANKRQPLCLASIIHSNREWCSPSALISMIWLVTLQKHISNLENWDWIGDVRMSKESEVFSKFAQVLHLSFYLCIHFFIFFLWYNLFLSEKNTWKDFHKAQSFFTEYINKSWR